MGNSVGLCLTLITGIISVVLTGLLVLELNRRQNQKIFSHLSIFLAFAIVSVLYSSLIGIFTISRISLEKLFFVSPTFITAGIIILFIVYLIIIRDKLNSLMTISLIVCSLVLGGIKLFTSLPCTEALLYLIILVLSALTPIDFIIKNRKHQWE